VSVPLLKVPLSVPHSVPLKLREGSSKVIDTL
jgi:hypothetical protein